MSFLHTGPDFVGSAGQAMIVCWALIEIDGDNTRFQHLITYNSLEIEGKTYA